MICPHRTSFVWQVFFSTFIWVKDVCCLQNWTWTIMKIRSTSETTAIAKRKWWQGRISTTRCSALEERAKVLGRCDPIILNRSCDQLFWACNELDDVLPSLKSIWLYLFLVSKVFHSYFPRRIAADLSQWSRTAHMLLRASPAGKFWICQREG